MFNWPVQGPEPYFSQMYIRKNSGVNRGSVQKLRGELDTNLYAAERVHGLQFIQSTGCVMLTTCAG